MRRFMSCLVVLVATAPGFANLISNPSFAEPLFPRASATCFLLGTLADGDAIAIDTNGVNRVYEFDVGNGIDPGSDIAVDISGGADSVNAANAFVDAVTNDPSAVCSAAITNIVGSQVTIRLEWLTDDASGDGAHNADLVDQNAKISIAHFNAPHACNLRYTNEVVDWRKAGGAWTDFGFPAPPMPSVPLDNRNAEVGIPFTCDGNGHGSLDVTLGTRNLLIYQNVSGLDPSKTYCFSGTISIGQNDGTTRYSAEMHDGLDAGNAATLIDGISIVKRYPGQYDWIPFSVSGSPSGTDVTVLVKMHRLDPWKGGALWLHVDNVELIEDDCTPPKITGVTPDMASAGTPFVDVTITGSGFVLGETSVKLVGNQQGSFEIPGVIQSVPDSNTIEAQFDLSSVGPGPLSMVVESPACGSNTLSDAILVEQAGPFENGSFEDPDPGNLGCSESPTPMENGLPSRWLYHELAGYGGDTALYRDELDIFPPTCPPPDGNHYASSSSQDNGGAQATNRVFQTITVDNTKTYTFSGMFAGGGNNNVYLELLDGGGNSGTVLNSTQIYSGGGQYDWTFAAISGQPSGDRMTVQYRIHLTGDPPHGLHADDLNVQICNDPISVDTITPALGVNNGPIAITDLEGTGFSDAAGVPQVLFSKVGGGAAVNATNVTVVDSARITCDVDLTDLTSGYYDVFVVQDGCIDQLPAAARFLVLGAELVNGEFEMPTASQSCGPPSVLVNAASGWNFNDDKWRDHNLWGPTCPRDIPAPGNHGHYQSLTTGADRQYRNQVSYQILSVTPGQVYRVSAYFAGGGTNTASLKLIDGDLNGTALDEAVIYDCSSGCGGYDWAPFAVTAQAESNIMTVAWAMTGASDDSALHADGFVMETVCNDPFADADNDGDVDHDDAAILQLCFTGPGGPIPATPAYCSCFDRQGPDGAITIGDVDLFEACASGPGIPADTSCDD